jgi:hypothetical protein
VPQGELAESTSLSPCGVAKLHILGKPSSSSSCVIRNNGLPFKRPGIPPSAWWVTSPCGQHRNEWNAAALYKTLPFATTAV